MNVVINKQIGSDIMFILTLILLVIDIISKLLVRHYLILDGSIPIINNFLDLTYVKNTGVAWSIFANNKYFVLILSGFIILGIGYYIYKEKPERKITKVAYSFILGGALGNFINRVYYGYVIDFIDIKIFGYNYPIFNVADIFIVVGVLLLIYDTWRWHDGDKSKR